MLENNKREMKLRSSFSGSSKAWARGAVGADFILWSWPLGGGDRERDSGWWWL